MRKFDCLVAGEANVDLLVESPSPLVTGKEMVARRMDLVLGGSSSITAFNLARLGTSVRLVSVLGSDTWGSFVAQRLADAGVDLTAIRYSQKHSTGITIWLSQKGQRAGVTHTGTISMLRSTDVAPKYLNSARHLHIGHYFLLTALHKQAPALFARAKKLGLTTSLDCNFDPLQKWQSEIWKVLPHIDVFFPNSQEALALTGCKTVAEAARELGRFARIVAVKLGSRGVLIHSSEEIFRMPARRVHVVDTTGAGDSFNAGFLSSFLRHASLRSCAASGIAAAARCVTRIGGTAAFEESR